MAKQHGTLDDALGAAIQTGVPLIVRRRCKPIEQAAWIAIRFLIDTTDRAALGSREIATEMNTSAYPRVKGWIESLVAGDVLEVAGYETIPNLDEPRAIYRIPWKRIFEASLIEAEKSVAGTNRKRQKRALGSDLLQLPMEFPVIDGSQSPVIDGSQGPVIDGSQSLLSIDHRACDPSITLGGREGGIMGGGESRTRAKKRGRPPQALTPPSPPDGESALPAHPFDLWAKACAAPRPIHHDHLTTLAAAHDESTGGHGLYWTGRAILAAAETDDIHSIVKVRSVMARWQRESSYGSALYKERSHGRPVQPEPAAGRTARPAQPAEPRPERRVERPALPPGLKIAGRRAPPDGAD